MALGNAGSEIETVRLHGFFSFADKEKRNRYGQNGGNAPQRPHSQISPSCKHQENQKQRAGTAYPAGTDVHLIGRRNPFIHWLKGFCEGDHIEGYRDCLRKIKRDSNRSPDACAKGAADDVIRAAARHAAVGCNLRNRQNRRNRHKVPQYDYHEAAPKPDMRHRVTKPQEKNCPEYSADGREKDRRRSESVTGLERCASPLGTRLSTGF